MSAGWTLSMKRRWLGMAIGTCMSVLVACGGDPGSGDSSSGEADATEAHRCAVVDGDETITREGDADCEAEALGGENNTSSAKADGDGSAATAVAGSLDLFDNGTSEDHLASDDNTSLADATNGAGAGSVRRERRGYDGWGRQHGGGPGRPPGRLR